MRIYFYIARKFWVPFFFALGVFTTLVVLGDTFEKMKNLSNGTTTMLDLLSYSITSFPNWLTTIMPVACLLGAISVISEMVANGEWTACIASGFAPRQLFKPIILCILSVVLLTLVVQEFILPPLNAKSSEIYYTRINPSGSYHPDTEQNVVLKIAPNQMLFAKEVNLKSGTMNRVSLDTYDNGWDIAHQIVADQMVWNPQTKSWLFSKGIQRTFLDPMDTTEQAFETAESPVSLNPSEMSVDRRNGKLLSIRELYKRTHFFKRSGLASYSEQTMMHSKLAMPLVTLVMCLLGMPFAISMRRKSKIVNIFASIVIAFLCWWLISMFTSIGENGYLNPILAGWGPVLFFAVVAFFEFKWLKL